MGLGVIGSLIGNEVSSGDRGRADGLRDQALREFSNLQLPDSEKLKLALERYSSSGDITPEMIELINQGDTALLDINVDPRLRQAQLDALEDATYVANNGMSPEDVAAFQLALRNSRGEAQAKSGQIIQNMQQRGQSGSGAELAAQLQNAQSAADQANVAGLEQAKINQQARRDYLTMQSDMASKLRNTDYTEQSNLAKAQDIINQFNTNNSQNIAVRNTGARNDAQASNLQKDQSIRNQNTGLSNVEQQYNKNLAVDDYNRKKERAALMSGQYQNAANDADARAGRTQDLYSGVGAGIQQGINSVFTGGMGGFGSKKPGV